MLTNFNYMLSFMDTAIPTAQCIFARKDKGMNGICLAYQMKRRLIFYVRQGNSIYENTEIQV